MMEARRIVDAAHEDRSTSRYSALNALKVLPEIIAAARDQGQESWIEGLSQILDMLEWRPLREAPRDGTWVTVATASAHGQPGFITQARWHEPSAEERASMGRHRKDLLHLYGGWWSPGINGRPFRRPIIAWRPSPSYALEFPNG
ncbi:hypothetical protein [Rhizorhabdus histidinilytica]|uniref:hypothetical protein n=1 Tax=Rhizorhabdus histidinilytica TaxID=439228 RepID=UPI00321FC6FB